MMQSVNKNSSIAWDTFNYDESIMNESQTLVEFNFLVSQNNLIYHRAYLKVQTVLASVGGLANIFRIVFIAICYTFSVTKRDEAILNKVFDFDIGENSVYKPKLFELKLNKLYDNFQPENEENVEMRKVSKLTNLNKLTNLHSSKTANEISGSLLELQVANSSIERNSLINNLKRPS